MSSMIKGDQQQSIDSRNMLMFDTLIEHFLSNQLAQYLIDTSMSTGK